MLHLVWHFVLTKTGQGKETIDNEGMTCSLKKEKKKNRLFSPLYPSVLRHHSSGDVKKKM